MKKITTNQTTWIDIQNPQENDLEYLKSKFRLYPFIAHQFLPPIHRPKIEEYPQQLFIVLHFPVFKPQKRETKPVELDFILTPQTLITSHLDKIPYLETFFNECQLQKYYQKRYFKSSGHLLMGLLDWLVDSCLPMLDHISEKIDYVEKQVFAGHEKEMLREIAIIKKDLTDFRRAIKPHNSILGILEKKSRSLFGHNLRRWAQEVVGSSQQVWTVLENHQELINSLEQTNNSLLSNRISEIIKVLTVISFITFPLSVIVGFFGMNVFLNLPVVNHPWAWLVILIFMALTTSLMVAYFKKRKWL